MAEFYDINQASLGGIGADNQSANTWSNIAQNAQNGPVDRAYKSSLTSGQNLQNQTVAQRLDQERAATQAFNDAWSAAQSAQSAQSAPPVQPDGLAAALQDRPSQAAPQPPNINYQSAASTPVPIPSMPSVASPTADSSIANHSAAQALYSQGNQADTTGSVAPNPTHADTQITPAGTLDRNKFYQSLANSGHAELIPEFQTKFLQADQSAQQAKVEQAIRSHAQFAAGIAAFQSLPDSMKPAAYQQELAGLHAQGVDISSLPSEYDPQNPDTVARVASLASDATTALDKLKAQHEANQDAQAKFNGDTVRNKNEDQSMSDYEKAQIGIQQGQLDLARLKQNQLSANGGSEDPDYLRKVAIGEVPVNPRSKEGQAIIKQAAASHPDTNIAAAQKFTADLGKDNAGTSGGIVQGANKSMEHLSTMQQADTGASSGGTMNTGPNWLSAAENSAYNTMASPNQKAVWDASHTALSNEMSRTFKGGAPGELEAVRDMKNLTYSDSPDRKAVVYKNYADLMRGQVSSIEQQRKTLYGSADPGTPLLASGANQIAQKLGSFGQSQLPVLGAADARNLKPGTRFMGTDGKEYVR